jgi:hypothetical protein
MAEQLTTIRALLRDIYKFCQNGTGITLRSYQLEVAEVIIESVLKKHGDSIVVMYPRQSGKNELQANIEAYLLMLYSHLDAEMVKVSPTWKPQSQNAMRRLQRVLDRNLIARSMYKKETGYIFRIGKARNMFLTGQPSSNVVGATANLLIQCDEAQDVLTAKWDKDFAPMAASTKATKVFWGTAWTSRTLLARELRAARKAEQRDGRRRVFIMTADDVMAEVPAYGKHVREQVRKLGRNHPLIKTQYYSEEIDAQGGMFPNERQALMRGQHSKKDSPDPNMIYALLLDVAGEDESASDVADIEGATALSNPGRDATALTVIEIDLDSLADELIKAPTYRVVNRYEWVGTKHTLLYGKIKALADHWQARYLVVDSTGVGEGLYSFLNKALPNIVIPYKFTSKSKSDLGWGFLAVVETGRFKDYKKDLGDALQRSFRKQVINCQANVLEGPGILMRWGVPDGTRSVEDGELVHDDLLISAALCSVLDGQAWGLAESEVIEGIDPLAGMGDVF